MILASLIKRLLNLNLKLIPLVKHHKENYESILDDPKSVTWLIINFSIFVLILISIGLMMFESMWENSREYYRILYIADWVISLIFAAEYFYRYLYARGRLKFLFNPMNIIDLVAFMPFFLEIIFVWMVNVTFLKAFRILRVFRTFKLIRHFSSVKYIMRWLNLYREEYELSATLVIIILLISSILMYHVEWWANPWFSSIPKTMRWCIVTITTVWYWDVYPITDGWKVLWWFIILIWPMIIAMISSITVLVFFEVAENNKNEKLTHKKLLPCPRCKNGENLSDSYYCRICWEKMINDIEEKLKIAEIWK